MAANAHLPVWVGRAALRVGLELPEQAVFQARRKPRRHASAAAAVGSRRLAATERTQGRSPAAPLRRGRSAERACTCGRAGARSNRIKREFELPVPATRAYLATWRDLECAQMRAAVLRARARAVRPGWVQNSWAGARTRANSKRLHALKDGLKTFGTSAAQCRRHCHWQRRSAAARSGRARRQSRAAGSRRRQHTCPRDENVSNHEVSLVEPRTALPLAAHLVV